MEREIEFKVIGPEKMHCGSCEQGIARALKRVGGVADVKASSAGQTIRVSINPTRITPEQVHSKLQELGYETRMSG
jgi:copper chaperone CopZ